MWKFNLRLHTTDRRIENPPRQRNYYMTWDLTSYFAEFNGAEMVQFKTAIRADVAALQQSAAGLPALTAQSANGWEDILLRNEDLSRRMSHLGSYIGCLASSDARNEGYQKEEAELSRTRAELAKVRIELLRACKSADDKVFAAFCARPALAGAHNYLTRLREEARRAMTSEKEILATDLNVDGIQAWGRLYDTVSAKLEFAMVYPDGKRARLPMSQRRSLMDDPDRRVRQAAFDGGNAAWQSVEDTAAAALNAIAGTRLTLNRHRGVDHFLDIALFQAAIGRKTLDAMFEALMANLEIPRRILRLKSQIDGAPTGRMVRSRRPPRSAESRETVLGQSPSRPIAQSFSRAYPALGRFFTEQVIGKNWVDWEPRQGKRPGGFCTSSMLSKESRIFMTYNEVLGRCPDPRP